MTEGKIAPHKITRGVLFFSVMSLILAFIQKKISKDKAWDDNDSHSHFRIVLIKKIVNSDQKIKYSEQIQDKKV